MPNRITTLFLFLLAFSAIPHGLEISWHFLIFSSAVISVGLVYVSSRFAANVPFTPSQLRLTARYGLVFVPWLIYTLFQLPTIQITSSLEGSLLLDENSIRFGKLGTISFYATVMEFIKYASYLTVFILSLLLISNKKNLLNFCKVLFFCSLCIAIYSLLNHFTKGQFDLIHSIPPWTISWDKATHGTFSYQNHYASFLTITIPLGLGLLIENNRSSTQKTSVRNLRDAFNQLNSPAGFYSISILVMYFALVLTSSRGGNAIFLICMSVTGMIVIAMDKTCTTRKKIRRLAKTCFVLALVLIIVLMTGLADSLLKRLTTNGFEPNGRDLMRQTAYQIIEQKPLFGTGAGTYPLIQHSFKSPKLGNSEMSKRAHNDYLELLANQGIIGFTLLALPILYILYSIFKSLGRNKKSSLYGVKAASFCSIITVLMHSMVDFNFQLPAIAIYFFAIMAIALKCDQVSRNNKIRT